MDLGEFIREIVVEPLELPVPQEHPAPAREPVSVPDQEHVPA